MSEPGLWYPVTAIHCPSCGHSIHKHFYQSILYLLTTPYPSGCVEHDGSFSVRCSCFYYGDNYTRFSGVNTGWKM